MYYVYEWYIKKTGEIFYVGKGTRRRYRVTKHNKFFNAMIAREECDSRIIKEFENEADAFAYEHERISELKLVGQCVCNIYDGGAGGTTSWWTPGRRLEYSEKNAMRSVEQRKRMSENNPMKNRDVAKRVATKKQRGVIVGDLAFSSVKEARAYFGVSFETIQTWCKKGINPSGHVCHYSDEPEKSYTGRYNKGTCKYVLYGEKVYECATDLAKELGLNQTSVSRWARRGHATDGTICRYLSSDEVHSKYDNQQPSRGNSDNSTPEGSTTNG